MSVETIAIIGAGELGCRIAQAAARAGLRVILEDISAEKLEQGAARIARQTEEEGSRGNGDVPSERILTRRDRRALKGKHVCARVETTNCLEEACREADLIVETVTDEEEMKLELFTIFDRFAKPGAILATTTKTASVDDLADMTFCEDRCVGMGFSSATGEEKLELRRGRATSDETLARCREFGRRIGMQVAVLAPARACSTTARG